MSDPTASTFEEGVVTEEKEGITITPGEAPKFDMGNWAADSGLDIEFDPNANAQVIIAALSERYPVPKKKNVSKEGLV